MSPLRITLGVPLVVFVAVSVVSLLMNWHLGNATLLAGAAISGLSAAALSDPRTGIATAGMYLVVVTAAGVLAFMLGFPADHS